MIAKMTSTWASVANRNMPMTATLSKPTTTMTTHVTEKTPSEITNNVVSSTVKSEVHPQALEIAKDFYVKFYDEIVQTQHRDELRSVFSSYAPQANNRAFSIVLYAMAKGMRVVNVFNHGQVEWRESSTTQEYLTTKKKGGKQKLIVQPDGWTSVGVPSTDVLEGVKHPIPTPAVKKLPPPIRMNDSNMFVSLAEATNTEGEGAEALPLSTESIRVSPRPQDTKDDTPSPRFSKEGEYIVKTRATTFPEYNMDELMERIRIISERIKTHDMEIENLIPFHREHLREMRRINGMDSRSELEERLRVFHDTQSQRIADMLDDIQDEMNRLIKDKRTLCDQLKM